MKKVLLIVGWFAVWFALGLGSNAQAQSFPVKFLSTNTTNSTLVGTGNYNLLTGIVVNTTTTLYYLKLYNKATAPVCGTDTPLWTVPVPFASGNAAGGFVLPLGGGLKFPSGLGFCITSGIADNNTGAAAAGVVVNLGVSK